MHWNTKNQTVPIREWELTNGCCRRGRSTCFFTVGTAHFDDGAKKVDWFVATAGLLFAELKIGKEEEKYAVESMLQNDEIHPRRSSTRRKKKRTTMRFCAWEDDKNGQYRFCSRTLFLKIVFTDARDWIIPNLLSHELPHFEFAFWIRILPILSPRLLKISNLH